MDQTNNEEIGNLANPLRISLQDITSVDVLFMQARCIMPKKRAFISKCA